MKSSRTSKSNTYLEKHGRLKPMYTTLEKEKRKLPQTTAPRHPFKKWRENYRIKILNFQTF